MPLKAPKTSFEVITPKDVEKDRFSVKSTSSVQVSSHGLVKILLGTPIDLILNILKREDRKLSENAYFYLL